MVGTMWSGDGIEQGEVIARSLVVDVVLMYCIPCQVIHDSRVPDSTPCDAP